MLMLALIVAALAPAGPAWASDPFPVQETFREAAFGAHLGARGANVALGLARARAVCAKLRALGLHAAFKAESLGPDQPCASNATAHGRALNRRVEVRIVYPIARRPASRAFGTQSPS